MSSAFERLILASIALAASDQVVVTADQRRRLRRAFTMRIHNELVDRGIKGARYSSSRLARGIRIACIPAGLVLGLSAEAASYQQGSLDRNIADLVVGWVLIGSGLLAWQQRPHRRKRKALFERFGK